MTMGKISGDAGFSADYDGIEKPARGKEGKSRPTGTVEKEIRQKRIGGKMNHQYRACKIVVIETKQRQRVSTSRVKIFETARK